MRYSRCEKINRMINRVMCQHVATHWNTITRYNIQRAFAVLPSEKLLDVYSDYPENIQTAIKDAIYSDTADTLSIMDYIQFEMAVHYATKYGDKAMSNQLLRLKTKYAEVINILITRHYQSFTPTMLALVSDYSINGMPINYYLRNSRISLSRDGSVSCKCVDIVIPNNEGGSLCYSIR